MASELAYLEVSELPSSLAAEDWFHGQCKLWFAGKNLGQKAPLTLRRRMQKVPAGPSLILLLGLANNGWMLPFCRVGDGAESCVVLGCGYEAV